MTELVRYDAACRAIAEAKSLDEVKDIRDKVVALQSYARIAKNRQLEVDAAEIRFRAERRVGEMMSEQPKNEGHRYEGTGGLLKNPPASLSDMGIDKNLAHRARAYAAIPAEEFESDVAEWRENVAAETTRVETKLIRRGERDARDSSLGATPSLPVGTFDLIYADPPWRYEHVKTESRAIENQYPTMSLEEIKALDVAGIAADDCVLFLWATSPKLAESIEVIEAWGFVYRTCAVWTKGKIGMGYYFRQAHELLLVATKGSPGTPMESERVSSVIEAPREKHSKKPEKVRGIIEAMYPQKVKVELFQREAQSGWAGWGNQA